MVKFDTSKYVEEYNQQQAFVAREQNLAAQRLSAAQQQASSVDAEGGENILQKVGGWIGGGIEQVENLADKAWIVDDFSALPVVGAPAKAAGEKVGAATGWAGENYMKAVDGIAAVRAVPAGQAGAIPGEFQIQLRDVVRTRRTGLPSRGTAPAGAGVTGTGGARPHLTCGSG